MEKICPFMRDLCIEDQCLAWEEDHCTVLAYYRNHQSTPNSVEAPALSSYDKNVARMDAIKQKYPKAYTSWTAQEDADLKTRFQQGMSVIDLANLFQRQPSAINSRLNRLGLGQGSGGMPIDLDTVVPKNPNSLLPPLPSSEEQKLWEELRKWRLIEANKEGYPAYVIAQDKVLQQVISNHVNTLEGLYRVRGFGEKRVDKYGEDLLKILTKYFPPNKV